MFVCVWLSGEIDTYIVATVCECILNLIYTWWFIFFHLCLPNQLLIQFKYWYHQESRKKKPNDEGKHKLFSENKVVHFLSLSFSVFFRNGKITLTCMFVIVVNVVRFKCNWTVRFANKHVLFFSRFDWCGRRGEIQRIFP